MNIDTIKIFNPSSTKIQIRSVKPVAIKLSIILLSLGMILAMSSCGFREIKFKSSESATGGVLKMHIYPPLTLDPVNDLSVYESFLLNQVHSGLVELDEGLRPIPGMAEFWTIDSTFTRFTFQLRPHITFQNGKPLEMPDVYQSFLYLIQRDAQQTTAVHHFIDEILGIDQWLAGEIQELPGITIIDSSHIQFTLKRSTPDFLYFFAADQAKIILREKPDALPVGAGPFMIKNITDTLITLSLFQQYFQRTAYLDSILLYLDDTSTGDKEFDYLLNGKVNFIECPLWGVDTLSTISRFQTQKRLSLEFDFIGLRVDRPPLNDINFRSLLFQRINWSRISKPDNPYFVRANGVIPPGMDGYRPDLVHPLFKPENQRDPELNLPEKFDRSLIYGVVDTVYVDTEDDFIIQDWMDLGVPLKWPPFSWSSFDHALTRGEMDFFVMGWLVEIPSTPRYLYNLFHSNGVGNYFGYHNPNVDALIQAALHTDDKRQQILLCQAIEDSILTDMPVIPSSFVFTAYAYDARFRNVNLSEMGLPTLRCEDIWIEKN
ncbi:MAG: ABC transporter substrate-binding protein [Candidatus Marinimicrobia bacterium]|nr:ABC transporter substrate-binding protein [Candidatus Neomarinimicrobiota bacterium]